MKINEELYLKKITLEIKKYLKENSEVQSFYDHLDSLDLKSLQDLSFDNDLKFFDKIHFIISVIISIIVHPHISNKGEDIVLRSDQVHSLQNDMFLKTIKDARLWKHNKDKEMIPENVHYYQNVDELRIYENIFIVMLIDILSSELNKYNEFYTRMILTYQNEEHLSLSQDKVQIAFDRIEILQKKIRKLKDTYFYKEIAKGGKTTLRQITPTNILLKDRLYNYCFKFYRELISYEDKENLQDDFLVYYSILFLKSLKELDFKLFVTKKDKLPLSDLKTIPSLTFHHLKFKLQVTFDFQLKALRFTIIHKDIKNLKTDHLLLIDSQSSWMNAFEKITNVEKSSFFSIEVLSLWNRTFMEEDKWKSIQQNILSEKEMALQYLQDHLREIKGSEKIYSVYCPVCKSKSIVKNESQEIYQCEQCHTIYTFTGSKQKEDTIWFIHLKR